MPFDRDLRDLLRATKELARAPAEGIRHQLASDLERAEHDVWEAEQRIVRQREIVEYWKAHGANSQLAEQLLRTFEDLLDRQRSHLNRLRALQKRPADEK